MSDTIDLIAFKSDSPKTPFAPSYFWVLGESILTEINCNELAKLILIKEKEIISTTKPVDIAAISDGYTGLGDNSLTARYIRFNVFEWNHDEILKLKKSIYKKYITFLESLNVPRSKVWIQCWANVLRSGQKINPHSHNTGPYCYLGGHFCVQAENTKTVYMNIIDQINDIQKYESENVPGKISFFQNCIPHYTTEHNGDKERITIAFDLIVDENYQNNFIAERKQHLIVFDDPLVPKEHFL